MFLAEREIRELIKREELVIEPLSEDTIRENGLDLRIGDEALFTDLTPLERVSQGFICPPNKAILLRSMEYIKMPQTLLGICCLRSSYARKGFSIPPCFRKGTLIRMADLSYRDISQLKVGDRLVGIDEKTGRPCFTEVVATSVSEVPFYYKIRMETGEEIECTFDHPFLTRNGWKMAFELKVGERKGRLSYDWWGDRVYWFGELRLCDECGSPMRLIDDKSLLCSRRCQAKKTQKTDAWKRQAETFGKRMWTDPLIRKKMEANLIKALEIAHRNLLEKIKAGTDTLSKINQRRKEGLPEEIERLRKIGSLGGPAALKKMYERGKWAISNCEKSLIQIIEKNNLPFKYVGNGKFMIGRKCPDFVHLSDKKVVEFAGGLGFLYTEDDIQEKVEEYARYGYDTLVLTSEDLRLGEEHIVNCLRRFSLNSQRDTSRVVKVERIDKPTTVFSIECQPVPVYLANNLAVHNTIIDGGFEGILVIEIHHHHSNNLLLPIGDRFLHLVLAELSSPAQYKGRFMGQKGIIL